MAEAQGGDTPEYGPKGDECRGSLVSDTCTDTSVKVINITGITGGTAENVVAAGIIHGNVTVGSEEYVQNLEAQTHDDIAVWTEGMVKVAAVDSVMQKLQKGNNWITITGNAGEGKTTLGYMVLKCLREQGQRVFKVDTPDDYLHVVRKRNNIVIMLNDVFGAFTFDSSALAKWQSVIEGVLNKHEKSKDKTNQTRILFISRRNVLEGARDHLGGHSQVILDKTCLLDLSEGKQIQERLEILECFLRETDLVIEESVKRRIVSAKTPHGFPHCCKIYVQLALKGEKIDIEKFFASPLQFLDRTTKVLVQNSNNMALLKAMIASNGMLDISSIADDQEREDIHTAAVELTGSYLKKTAGRYMFSHPSVYESVICVVGGRDQVFVVRSASLSVLLQKLYIKQNEQDSSPGFINVDPLPKIMHILAEKFRPQVLGKNFSVFRNLQLCQNVEFCRALVASVTRKSWISLDLFKNQTLYINDEDSDGRTMLLVAEESGNYSAVKVLLEHGADVNKVKSPWYFGGKSAFHVACERKEVDIEHIKLLIKHGADVNKAVCRTDPYFLFECLIVNLPTSPYVEERTVLHHLCGCDHPDINFIRLLLEHGSDVNKTNVDGKTAFQHYLCNHEPPDMKVIDVLIKHGSVDVNKGDVDGKTALHFQCTRDQLDVSLVELLVKHGSDMNKADVKGWSAFHYLCSRKQLDISIIELFIEQGADVNTANGDGKTALHYICDHDQPNISIIELLIKHGADVNKASGDGKTALHYLCSRHQPDISILYLLIKHGADVNKAYVNGWTALHYLCRRDQPDISIIEMLIRKGSQVNATDCDGQTVLHYLCKRDKPDVGVIELLIKHGTEVNIADVDGWTPIHCLCIRQRPVMSVIEMLIKEGADVNATDADGQTALHYLCRLQQPDVSVMELLIRHDANVNKANITGETALHYLCNHDKPGESAIRLLIKFGADVNKSATGVTPLHCLVSHNKPDIRAVELLIQLGAGVNKTDHDGRTPLHCLCSNSQPDISAVKLLIQNGADVSKTNVRGLTALYLMCLNEQKDFWTLELLIKHGAGVNKSDSHGGTVLHFLCSSERPDVKVIELLIRNGADVNKVNDDGLTALHYVCMRMHKDVSAVELLIMSGADVNQTNVDGQTALHYQCRQAQPCLSVVDLLIKHGADVNQTNCDGQTALHLLCRSDKPDVRVIELLIKQGTDVQKPDNDGKSALCSLYERNETVYKSVLPMVMKGAVVR